MLKLLNKIIPIKIKEYLIPFYFFLISRIKSDNKTIYIYLKLYNINNLQKKIKIKFFNHSFFIPQTIRNAYIIMRTEEEEEEIELLHKKFLEPTTYIDVGSNIGYWTFARSHVLKGNINFFCFEPSKFNFKYLKLNLYKLKNVRLINSGLSNKSETRTLSFPHWEKKRLSENPNTGLLSLYGDTNILSENVELITLDDYFKDQDFNTGVFIKIDAEGHEHKILQGSKKFLSRGIDIIVQLEINANNEIAINNDNSNMCIKFLKELGYLPFSLINSKITILSDDEIKKTMINKTAQELYFTNKKII
jgi:FkbM family methyltransferase